MNFDTQSLPDFNDLWDYENPAETEAVNEWTVVLHKELRDVLDPRIHRLEQVHIRLSPVRIHTRESMAADASRSSRFRSAIRRR